MPTTSKGVDTSFDPSFGGGLNALIAEVERQGGHVSIDSGFRSQQHQADMLANPGKYGIAPGTPIAKPGQSDHQFGTAADLGGDARTHQLLHDLAPKYGIRNDIANDPVHFYIPHGKNPQPQPGTYSPGVDNAAPVPVPLIDRLGLFASLINPEGAKADTSADTSIASGINTASMTENQQNPNQPIGQPRPPAPPPQGQPQPQQQGGGSASGNYADLFNKAGAKYGIDARLLSAVAKQESGYNPGAKSPSGALGLMQFMPGTAQGLGVDPMNPESAVDGAARLLSGYMKDYGGDISKALAAYNAGPGAVKKYGGVPPYQETQNYVHTIMGALHG